MATPFWNLLKFDESLLFPLQLAATINCNLSTGETALYIAVTEYVQEECKGKRRETSLHHASKERNIAKLKWLNW